MYTEKTAYALGLAHGGEMARDSGSDDPGVDGWDGMLINADPSFVRHQFGWKGADSSVAAVRRMEAYVRGCQEGASAELANHLGVRGEAE